MYRPPGAARFSRQTWFYLHDSVSHRGEEGGGSSNSLGGSRASRSSADARELAASEDGGQ